MLEPKQIAKSAGLINPVENLWTVELLRGRHFLHSEPTYGLHMRSKLVGEFSKCYLLVDIQPDSMSDILYSLNIFGHLERVDLMRVLEYAKQLKINGIYRDVPDLLPHLESYANDIEGSELHIQVMEYILDNPGLFPSISSGGYTLQSLGVYLDTDSYIKRYGAHIFGITTEALVDILGLEGDYRKRLIEITRSWLKSGLLVKRSGQSRLQESIRPLESSREIKRFYLLKVTGLDAE